MGNSGSAQRDQRSSEKRPSPGENVVPEITVIEASPLPEDSTVFHLPGPVGTGRAFHTPDGPAEPAEEEEEEEEDHHHQEAGAARSLCGSDSGSRQLFLESMMRSSPQLCRGSTHLSSRSDSASLVSSTQEEEGASAALDPLEHEWMLCCSDGDWSGLRPLLDADPLLVLRKDFITGFTCLHWAAKYGDPELVALLVTFAEEHGVPLSVDVRSGCGYTPLHVAAMHGHQEVVKLLVGAYDADVELRDHSGRKACHYLNQHASLDIRDIIGAYEEDKTERRDGGRRRFSKVLRASLKSVRDGASGDGDGRPGEKLFRRRSSLSGVKPRLQKLRMRTSQLLHSTSLRDERDGPIRPRPKTHFFS